jgi:hypothetical protein
MLKRQSVGTHHWVSPKHLDQYVSEMAWRLSRCELSPQDRINELFSAVGRAVDVQGTYLMNYLRAAILIGVFIIGIIDSAKASTNEVIAPAERGASAHIVPIDIYNKSAEEQARLVGSPPLISNSLFLHSICYYGVVRDCRFLFTRDYECQL